MTTNESTGFDLNKPRLIHEEQEQRMFVPSKYQEAIFEWVVNGTGNGFCDAVPGSGKTTTLIEAAKLIDVPGLVLMFSKRMQQETAPKFAGTTFKVQTCHSLGFQALRTVYPNPKVESNKYRKMIYKLLDQAIDCGEVAGQRFEDWTLGALSELYPVREIAKLVDLVRATLTDTSDHSETLRVAAHYGVDIPPELSGFCAMAVDLVLKRGIRLASKIIDYGDMVWLPCITPGMTVPRHKWVFIDEAQDLTSAQRTIAIMACQANGRMLFVGDKYQSIFGFTGADTNSVDRIIEATNATLFPLSVCYRCPTSHLDIARQIVPHIENAPNAILGTVDHIHIDTLAERAEPGDLILCRLTAPLISAAYGLIREGVAARVIGRDIGAGILRLMEKVWKDQRVHKFSDLIEAITDYSFEQETLLLAETDGDEEDPRIQRLRDRCDCLTIIIRCSDADNRDALALAIDRIFNDQDGTVDLSTVHRAKGLEAHSVYILQRELMPSPFARMDWQQDQEQYCINVANTRSTYALTYISV